MNDTTKRIIEDRMRRGDRRGGRDYADYGIDRRDYRGDSRGEMRGDGRGSVEYRGEYEHDGRRGMYGTGRYGVGGRDHGEDYRGGDMRGDYRSDMRGRDYGEGETEEVKLSKSDMKRWKKMLKNGDGTTGEHFTAEQIHDVAHQVGASYDEYEEHDLCMAANMLYSDLCEALRMLIPKEKEALIYAKMARYWLEDEDGPKGSEKLAMYFYCIVDDE
jgi:hypothetical protein